jgi:membrane-bound ClpP family serine protease
MTLIILLYALGIVLIAVEVIVPGGILGSAGALLMFAGCIMAFVNYGTGGGFIALLAAVALGSLALYIELRVLPKTKIGRRVFLTSEITAVTSAVGKNAGNLIGRPAEALTMLSPSGYVRIDGRRYEAFCQSGQVPAGAALTVIGADNFRLIVALTTPN